MTRAGFFSKEAKCQHGRCSSMSNSAWCVLNTNGTFLKLNHMCPNSKCKRQKQIDFTPRHFELQASGSKNTLEIFFE